MSGHGRPCRWSLRSHPCMDQMPGCRPPARPSHPQCGLADLTYRRQATEASKSRQGRKVGRRSTGEPHQPCRGWGREEAGGYHGLTPTHMPCQLVPFLPVTRQSRRPRNLAETGTLEAGALLFSRTVEEYHGRIRRWAYDRRRDD